MADLPCTPTSVTVMKMNSAYGTAQTEQNDQENGETIYSYPYIDSGSYTGIVLPSEAACGQVQMGTLDETVLGEPASTEQPNCDNEEDIYSYIT